MTFSCDELAVLKDFVCALPALMVDNGKSVRNSISRSMSSGSPVTNVCFIVVWCWFEAHRSVNNVLHIHQDDVAPVHLNLILLCYYLWSRTQVHDPSMSLL